MPVVTLAEFESRLNQHKGSLMAVIVTRTRPKLLAKSRETKEVCPWPMGIERVAARPVVLGAIYENSVNLARERDADGGEFEPFTAAGLWKSKEYPEGAGERDGAYAVRHKGTAKRYFAVRAREDGDGHAVVWADQWTDVATGLAVDYDDVKEYLPKSSGGEIAWRTLAVENVEQVRTFGETFDIVSEEAAVAEAAGVTSTADAA